MLPIIKTIKKIEPRVKLLYDFSGRARHKVLLRTRNETRLFPIKQPNNSFPVLVDQYIASEPVHVIQNSLCRRWKRRYIVEQLWNHLCIVFDGFEGAVVAPKTFLFARNTRIVQ